MSDFFERGKRLRTSSSLRLLTNETTLCKENFILPIFLVEGSNIENPVPTMPGVYQHSIDKAIKYLENLIKQGLTSVLLFGIPPKKDASGSYCTSTQSIIPVACAAIKKEFPTLLVITDICMCEYTDHGHCGILKKDGQIDNDATLEILAKQAVLHAQSGADMLAPSAMADGMVFAIRKALDKANFEQHPIMSYSAKYASCFYGPFREAAQSTPSFGNRNAYQMSITNQKEALKEIVWDDEEGADILMVKPALPYLDIIALAKKNCLKPIAAYQVSGEYAMIKMAAKNKIVDEERAMLETLTSIKRAGADIIISYFTPNLLKILK